MGHANHWSPGGIGNEEQIKRGRTYAKSYGHDLGRGQWSPATKNHAAIYYAWCRGPPAQRRLLSRMGTSHAARPLSEPARP